jgi:NTP pyrophosphatase (non-canonical NTP hydrolase)
MSNYDNPAGRLHALLAALSEHGPDTPLIGAWGNVLNMQQADVPLGLTDVAQLVRDVQNAAEETGADPWKDAAARWRDEWSKPIFPTKRAMNDQLKHFLPSPDALNSLAVLDVHLQRVAPEGRIPADDQVQRLSEDLRELIDAVQESELTDELKHEITDRLTDVLKAIDHLKIGGPLAPQRAMEALLGSVALREPKAFKLPIFERIVAIALVTTSLFGIPPAIQDSIEASKEIAGELSAAVEKGQDVIEGEAVEEPAPDAVGDGGQRAPAREDPAPKDAAAKRRAK